MTVTSIIQGASKIKCSLCPFRPIPAANSSRTRPWRPRASRHIRESACDPRGDQKAKVHIHGAPTGAEHAARNLGDNHPNNSVGAEI